MGWQILKSDSCCKMLYLVCINDTSTLSLSLKKNKCKKDEFELKMNTCRVASNKGKACYKNVLNASSMII